VQYKAVIESLRVCHERDVPPKQLPDKLAEIAARHCEMLARLAALIPQVVRRRLSAPYDLSTRFC
jgi:hypothetical protein